MNDKNVILNIVYSLWLQLGIVVTTKELDEILKETRKTCPGQDKILEQLPKNVKAPACLLISSSINNSYVPANWKESQIKMIPKQDKDRSKAENYRPISLTNCIAKICETVVKNVVMENCESQNIFGETLSAYRKHRCTTDNLIKLLQHVSEAFQWSEMVDFVCLDVKKEFDVVWRLRLVHKLNSIGLIQLEFSYKVDKFILIAKECVREDKLHCQW